MFNWQKVKKEKNGEPILVLAPMADVTDPAFRFVIAKYGQPDVFWTEFVSADGLFLSPIGKYCQKFIDDEIDLKEFKKSIKGVSGEDLIKDLSYDKSEKPIVAQFFTSKPEMIEKASKLANKLGFSGVDINMGCPDKSVEKQGAGASLIKNPKLAKELVLSAKAGANGLPVSVKTRIGYNKNELETWLPELLSVKPDLITIHCRTRKEMSLVPARWEHIKRAVEIRDFIQKDLKPEDRTLIFGNGDVLNTLNGIQLCKETDSDGAMLGRAIFGNPWLFSKKGTPADLKERMNVLVEHTKLFEKLCAHKSFAVMKKHYKAYVNGFDGAKELRAKLMDTNNASEVESIIQEYFN
jgi:tRNA-dihydrouridine synthase